MAHFAKIENGTVAQVLFVANDLCGGGDFPESESAGQAFLESLGLGTNWKQTSYNGNIRKQYAGIDYTYDAVADVFVAPQPYPSWTLDNNHDWKPPTPYPTDGKIYCWDEGTISWVARDADATE